MIGQAADAYQSSETSDKNIGPFRIVRLLGHGGQGSVYESARETGGFQQRVAIKLLKWETDPASKDRFPREQQILAGLEHPNIARLFDGGETEDGSPYLVMEFVDDFRAAANAYTYLSQLGLAKHMRKFLNPTPLRLSISCAGTRN